MAVPILRAAAEEPLFGYVYTTDLVPHGKRELQQWATWRSHKPVGEFDAVEGRTEFEYRVNDRFQVAAYVNCEWARAYPDNAINGSTLPPESLATLYVGPDERLNTARFTGVSLEGIYRLWSHYVDPVGVALYIRPTVGPQFRELEFRRILQENLVDDRLVFACNAAIVEDWRSVPVAALTTQGTVSFPALTRQWSDTSNVNLGVAGGYRFANPFHSGQTNIAYDLGPDMRYAGPHLFATLTYLNQQPGGKDYLNTGNNFVVGGRNYAADAERFRLRLRFGGYF